MYCPNCDAVGIRGNYCGMCGTKTFFGTFPCPACHAPNHLNSNFCEHCGKPVQEAKKEFVAKILKGGGDTK